jgi:hypothetical protein
MMGDQLDLTRQQMPVEDWLPYFVRRMQDNVFSPEDVHGILNEIWKTSPDANEDQAYHRWKAGTVHSEEQ